MSKKRDEFSEEITARRHWMAVLARASAAALETAWEGLSERPLYQFLRPPETGLAMVQARMGGTGRPFNLGEMTVTRCSVLVAQGTAGHAYVAGHNRRHAELAAVFDALLQDTARRETLLETIIHPLKEADDRCRQSLARKTAATKVDFFTMVRGDD